MRPPTAISTDADLNLLDAVRIAAAPHAGGMGVLTVLNNEIHSARDVAKANTFRVETFRPNELGFLGYADSDGQVVFYRAPLRRHTTATPFDVAGREGLPRVEIVYAYAGADGALVDAVRQMRPDGLVVAGFGGGTFPPAFIAAAARAVDDGIPVVLASRSHRRPGGQHAPQGAAGLSGFRQSAAPKGPRVADAGLDGKRRPPMAATGVSGLLSP